MHNLNERQLKEQYVVQHSSIVMSEIVKDMNDKELDAWVGWLKLLNKQEVITQ